MNIKERVHELYDIIHNAEDELKSLREQCTHENRYFGHYSWAPGHIDDGFICEDCGTFLGGGQELPEIRDEYIRLFNLPDFVNLPIYNELKEFVNNYVSINKALNDYLNSMSDEELETASTVFKLRDISNKIMRLQGKTNSYW